MTNRAAGHSIKASSVDSLIAYRGTERLWVAGRSPDAERVVSSDNIYAVTKTGASMDVRKIRITQLKSH